MVPKKNRLPKDRIKKTLHKGKRIEKDILRVKYLRGKKTTSRFCVIISLKISPKATLRNRLRRQIFEIIRQNTDILKSTFDIVFIGKPKITEVKKEELKINIIKILKKIQTLDG